MEVFLVVLLMLAAIGLFILEIFFLPGTTISGIAGALFAAGGICYSYIQLGVAAGNITIAASALVFGVMFLWLMKSGALNKIALNENIDSKVESIEKDKIKPGDKGITLSRLNPMGKVRINGEIVEAKSTGDFIDEGKPIVVLKVYATNVLVEPDE